MGVGSMDNNRQHAVFREILLEEMKTDIVMAKEGQMPPSLYQNRLQDLKNAMEAALISKQEYESLSRQFQTSVKSAEQITDQAYAKCCVEESDGSIQYFWQGAGNSVVIIFRNGEDYFPVVYLNDSALGDKTVFYSKQCKDELLAHAASRNITPVCRTDVGQVSCGLRHFPSLEEALGYVITELNGSFPRKNSTKSTRKCEETAQRKENVPFVQPLT